MRVQSSCLYLLCSITKDMSCGRTALLMILILTRDVHLPKLTTRCWHQMWRLTATPMSAARSSYLECSRKVLRVLHCTDGSL